MNVGIAELSQEFDTVTLCLSKGLGCPMGAVLAFKNNFSLQAERLKHLFGGAMRQSGMTAAAGIYALKNHIERLVEDHKHAEIFFKKLKSEIEEIRVEEHEASTNMVFFEWQGLHLSSDQFYQACVNQGLRFSRTDHNRFRAVMHLGVSRKDVNLAAEVLKKVIKN